MNVVSFELNGSGIYGSFKALADYMSYHIEI